MIKEKTWKDVEKEVNTAEIEGIKNEDVEPSVRDWYFSFGCGHEHFKKYVKINGTNDGARDKMFKHFGRKWSMQYKDFESLHAEKWGLTELILPEEESGE